MAWSTILFLFGCLLLCVSAHQDHDNNPSAYEALKKYNFPAGILPKGATGYKLNPSTGEFSAYFNGSCSFALKNTPYQLKYKPVISGVISKGRLQKLHGVSVKVVMVWLNIVEVKLKGDRLEFSVGFMSADFGVDNFEYSPQCGCGFDCGKGAEQGEWWSAS